MVDDSRFSLKLVLDNDDDMVMYCIVDSMQVFKNFYCLNPSEEELENYKYLCSCLNKFNEDLNTAWELMESVNKDDISLKQKIHNFLLEEIKDCEVHMEGKGDEYINGRMYEIKVLMEELVK